MNTMNTVTVEQAAQCLDLADAVAPQISEALKEEASRKWAWLLGFTQRRTPLALREAARDDATKDPMLLCQLLRSEPADVLAWFEAEDHSAYDLSELVGNEDWVQTVIERLQGLVGRSSAGTFRWQWDFAGREV